MKEQRTNTQVKKKKKNLQYPPPAPSTPSYKSTNPHISHPPTIGNSNTMEIEFLVQIRQSDKCGNLSNDDVFNLYLGPGVGPGVSISCLQQDTRHIY